jgi:predicted deacylase
LSKTRLFSEVDYTRNGKQYGFLRLPYSTHESAYGFIPIPVICIKNGSGPRVLLVAGNHGDEYEGQVALTKLARENPETTAKMIELSKHFGAPVSVIGITDIPDNLAVAARNRGLIHMGTELGGAGTVSLDALRMVESGLRRALAHIGVLPPDPKLGAPAPTRMMEVGGPDYYVYAPDDGVFEPMFDLTETVSAGQIAGAIHFPENPGRESLTVPFLRDGMVICKRVPARTRRGDCLFHLASDITV